MPSVEVAYAEPDEQFLETVELPAGATVADALRHSTLADAHPQADLASAAVGIWGQPVDRGQVLADGDRVEVYRPLPADPREARRARARSGQGQIGPGLNRARAKYRD